METDWNLLIVAVLSFSLGLVFGVGLMTLLMLRKFMKYLDNKVCIKTGVYK